MRIVLLKLCCRSTCRAFAIFCLSGGGGNALSVGVELVWLMFLLLFNAYCRAQFLLELRCRSFLLVFCSFCLSGGMWGKCFVELACLNFLFNVGLAQFCFGAVLSDFPVGLSPFFV